MILIAAALSAEPIPVVAPADPTAAFRGDGSALKFDPACRDYDLETLPTNSACAARVASLEPSPAMAVAVTTMINRPERAAEALDLLSRTVTKSDHPAAHYLLGSMLAGAQVVPPDYGRAARHLEIAAKRGNPAAADLLANLLLAGKGTARDVPRAITLLQQAATKGYPTAGVSLAQLYLQGRLVPEDKLSGVNWLRAVTVVDARFTPLLAMAASPAKVTNYQLIPSPDPAKVRLASYGVFDNPEIPPGLGFDPEFQKVYRAPYDDVAIKARLLRTATTMSTPYLYELARRLSGSDPDKAAITYLLAKTRMAYDVRRCSDPAALEAITAWDKLMVGELRYVLLSKARLEKALPAALAAEATMSGDAEPWWVCRAGMNAMTDARAGKTMPLPLKPRSEWPGLRAESRSAMREAIAAIP